MDLLADVRFSFRTLRKNPGFTALAIAILALGIGINAAVFTVTNAVLFRGFPHVDPDNRILYIGTNHGVSYADFEDWRTQARSFQDMAVVANGGLRFILGDETCDGTQLSANSFQVLGQKPILGRDFAASDERAGSPAVTILTYGFWQRRYAKDASIVGKTVRLNGTPTTVIGVMPPGFDFPHHRVDLWIPMPATALQKRDARILWFAFGRIADGVTIRTAQAEMDTIGRRLESDYPVANHDVLPRVVNFRGFIGPNAVEFYGVIWGAVGFVLLIACANLANLQLARAIGRLREISIRIALGAGRSRIIRQLLIESLLLSSVGGAFGWLIANGGVRGYELLANPPSSYDHWDFALDHRVVFYLVAISIATGLLFGIAPALRVSKLDSGRRRKGLSRLLVIAEMALAVVLLAGAGLMIRSFLNIYTADLGVGPRNILTAAVRLPAAKYPSAQAQAVFFDRLITRLKIIPGVNSVALANGLPGLYAPRVPFDIAGDRVTLSALVIGPDYFRTLGAALLSGREFNHFDGASGMPVAIVNQRFVSEFWPGQNPLGKRFRLSNAWLTVVGVASNIVQNDNTGQTFDPVVYIPYRQKPAADMDVLVRTGIPPRSLEAAFRHEIHTIDPELVIYSGLGSVDGPRPLTESLALNNYWSKGVNAALFLIFSAIALLIAVVGLYAVISHSVSQRTQEIGIRMAIGATARDILKLVFLQGMTPLGIGLVIGLAGSLAITRVLKSELVHISPADPITLTVTSAVLVLCALLGCLIPAFRALRVDPVVTLRHE